MNYKVGERGRRQSWPVYTYYLNVFLAGMSNYREAVHSYDIASHVLSNRKDIDLQWN
jgi:hypothetical protein